MANAGGCSSVRSCPGSGTTAGLPADCGVDGVAAQRPPVHACRTVDFARSNRGGAGSGLSDRARMGMIPGAIDSHGGGIWRDTTIYTGSCHGQVRLSPHRLAPAWQVHCSFCPRRLLGAMSSRRPSASSPAIELGLPVQHLRDTTPFASMRSPPSARYMTCSAGPTTAQSAAGDLDSRRDGQGPVPTQDVGQHGRKRDRGRHL